MSNPKFLYHYTNYEGYEAIDKSGYIRGSSNKTGDAVYGNGVYLTSLGPQTPPEKLAENNWDGNQDRLRIILKEKRTSCYFKFLTKVLKGVKKVGDDRDVWLYPGDIQLAGTGAIVVYTK